MKRLVIGIASLAASVGLLAPALAGVAVAGQAKEFTLVSGWYRDRQVDYYDFGANTKLAGGNLLQAAPIYVFIHGMNADGSPDFVDGQHNIVDVVPGDAGYSDLWQVMMVTVPDGYDPDSITSKDELDESGLDVTATSMFVNCPIVPEGSILEGGEPLTQGWYKGEEVFYPDFGQNNQSAIPIYVFVHGMNADGSPDFVEGQRNIIDAVPGDAGYSAFWRVMMVTVPQGYVPDSIRSRQDLMTAGYPIAQTDMVVNCPVTDVSTTVQRSPDAPMRAPATAQPVGAPNTGTGDARTGGGSRGIVLALALGVVGATLAGGAAVVRRRAP